MDRRTFLTLAAAGASVAAARHVAAQPASTVRRIGWLHPTSVDPRPAFREALRQRGHVEGKNTLFEVRLAGDKLERLPALAAELVAANVDVIVAVAPGAIVAAKKATTNIPIVMAYWGGSDPVAAGIIESLARPGGNITGVHMLNTALEPKRLELLLAAVPHANRVAVLIGPFTDKNQLVTVRKFAESAGVRLQLAYVADGYKAAFDTIRAAQADALLVPSSTQFVNDRRIIIDFAARQRIPAMYEWAMLAHEGGLMAYGPSQSEMDRQAAAFVDKILRGARPAELPVEQPTKFELVVNLKTARDLGVALPPPLLQRADQLIE